MKIVPKVPLKLDLIISIFIYMIHWDIMIESTENKKGAANDLEFGGTLGALVRYSVFCILGY